MSRRVACWVAVLLATVANGLGVDSAYSQAAETRPIEDLLAAQGTYPSDGSLFVPPVKNFIGWFDPDSGLFASVDYAGLADQWITDATDGEVTFNTQFAGTIVETPLADGRTKVHVMLKTTNALTWVFDIADFTGDFVTVPLLLGARAPEVLLGAEPTLGDSLLHVTFIHDEPVGGDLPDLSQLLFEPTADQQLLRFSFHSSAIGETADGSLARLTVQQQGNFQGYGKNRDDKFPVETVRLQPVGQ